VWAASPALTGARAQPPAQLEPVDVTDVQIEKPIAVATHLEEPLEQRQPEDKPSAGSMILFENVTKVYEPDVTALDSVSFGIDKGEFVFVVGASGSGKTTLVRLLLK